MRSQRYFLAFLTSLAILWGIVEWVGRKKPTYVCCLARAGTMVYPIRYELDGDRRFGTEFDVPTNILCQVTTTPCPGLEAP